MAQQYSMVAGELSEAAPPSLSPVSDHPQLAFVEISTAVGHVCKLQLQAARATCKITPLILPKANPRLLLPPSPHLKWRDMHMGSFIMQHKFHVRLTYMRHLSLKNN